MKTTIQKILSLIILICTIQVSAQTEFQVQVLGKGEPLFLFPGFTSTNEVWEDFVEEVSQHYQVHSFTFAGFGKVAPIETPWLPKIKTAIETYVSEKQLKNPVIIGHSMGGTLGLWLAAENPGTFKKIIVVDALPAMGALMIPDYKSENIVYDNPYNNQLLGMNDEDFSKMASQMAAAMSRNEDKHELLKNWIVETDRKTFVYGYTDLIKLDLREDLGSINIPVSILAATEPYGKEVAEKNYREQYQHLKSYTLHFAENAGHFVMFDKPEWFLEKLRTELNY